MLAHLNKNTQNPGEPLDIGAHAQLERPESTTVAGSSLIGGVQPSNVESKTTVDTRPIVGRNQSIPIKQKSANNNVNRSNDLSSGYGGEANRRGYGNRFDHYDEVKATGNKLTRHPATATGGKRINI